ncbi:hypothetical protein ACFRCI_23090 [Streptomyces sp. NPDC056638]|uniref:hypothetical protein n=1 Tax=Streptomyces sp. NPDC056638 TaxID=3345887 RepID=UPI0036A2754E
MTLYVASFIARRVRLRWSSSAASAARLAVGNSASPLTPLVLTAALVPLVGQCVARRKSMQHTFPGFGSPRPTPGFFVRFGIPTGLAALWAGRCPMWRP